MSNVFLTRMPAGIPGQVTRTSQATIEPQILDATNPPTAYGVPMAIDATSHNARKIIAGDTAASVDGFYVRPYPFNSGTDGLGTSTPPSAGIANVLRRGYISVKLNVGSAVKGGAVYVRTVANGGNTIIGGIEAAADGSNTFQMTNTTFSGPADANGNVEIAFNL